MVAITGAILGAASLGYGLFSQHQAQENAREGYAVQQQGAQIQAQAAHELANISRDQAAFQTDYAGRELNINEGLNQASLTAFQQTRGISNQMVGNQRAQDAVRMQAMEMDAARRGREIIRNQQRARSLGLVAATAQGAGRGSGLQGGYGQTQGQTGVNANAVNQSLLQGRQMFGLANAMTDLRLQYSDIENNLNLYRANAQTQKSQLVYDLAVANAGFQNRTARAQERMSQGQGYVNRGAGMVNVAQSQGSSANTFIQAGLQLPTIGANLQNVFSTNFFNPTPVSSATSWEAPLDITPSFGYTQLSPMSGWR